MCLRKILELFQLLDASGKGTIDYQDIQVRAAYIPAARQAEEASKQRKQAVEVEASSVGETQVRVANIPAARLRPIPGAARPPCCTPVASGCNRSAPVAAVCPAAVGTRNRWAE